MAPSLNAKFFSDQKEKNPSRKMVVLKAQKGENSLRGEGEWRHVADYES